MSIENLKPGMYKSYAAIVDDTYHVQWDGLDGYLSIRHIDSGVTFHMDFERAQELIIAMQEALDSQPQEE